MEPISNKDNLTAEMFRVAMALEKPWELTHIEFDDQDEAWHLFVNFEKGAAFACPNCGASSNVHDTAQKHWRHHDFWNWKTYIHARVPRTECSNCGKILLVPCCVVTPEVALYAVFRSLGQASDGRNACECRRP